MPQNTTPLAANRPTNIAIFASGGGSNALRIIEHFEHNESVNVSLVIANKPHAGVLNHAHDHHIPSLVITKRLLNNQAIMNSVLDAFAIDFVALAGFLLLMPAYIVERFEGKIVNIHPALLPKYGGKGMYGMHVHRAVKENGETVSGPTIHFVNTKYDEGNIIYQATTPLEPSDTPEDIAAKVLRLEHRFYPRVIEHLIEKGTPVILESDS